MSILLDKREGSWQLSRLEPLRSILPVCTACGGSGVSCPICQCFDKKADQGRGQYVSVGRQLCNIRTSQGTGGPDILICGKGPGNRPILIAVEVKEVRDLLQSADTGRLQSPGEGQLPAMLADYDQSWLLWYGQIRCSDSGYLEEPGGRGGNGRCIWKPFVKNGSRRADDDPPRKPLPCSYLDSMLFAIAAMGVHVHHVGTDREAARWIAALYTYWTKDDADHRFTRTFNSAPRFPRVATDPATGKELDARTLARARRVFDRYPGLGMERSIAAAVYFPTVRAMANADEAEWRKVPGIGPVIAAHVVEAFNS